MLRRVKEFQHRILTYNILIYFFVLTITLLDKEFKKEFKFGPLNIMNDIKLEDMPHQNTICFNEFL
jgi:hypothetical protein